MTQTTVIIYFAAETISEKYCNRKVNEHNFLSECLQLNEWISENDLLIATLLLGYKLKDP